MKRQPFLYNQTMTDEHQTDFLDQFIRPSFYEEINKIEF